MVYTDRAASIMLMITVPSIVFVVDEATLYNTHQVVLKHFSRA